MFNMSKAPAPERWTKGEGVRRRKKNEREKGRNGRKDKETEENTKW